MGSASLCRRGSQPCLCLKSPRMLLRITDAEAFHRPNESLGEKRWGTGHKYFLEARVESSPTRSASCQPLWIPLYHCLLHYHIPATLTTSFSSPDKLMLTSRLTSGRLHWLLIWLGMLDLQVFSWLVPLALQILPSQRVLLTILSEIVSISPPHPSCFLPCSPVLPPSQHLSPPEINENKSVHVLSLTRMSIPWDKGPFLLYSHRIFIV